MGMSDVSHLLIAVTVAAVGVTLIGGLIARARRERVEAAQADERHEWSRRWHRLECRRVGRVLRREDRGFE